MEHPNSKQINAFNACVASLQGLAELILVSTPATNSLAQFEFSVYEALGHLSDAQKLLENPDGFAPPLRQSSGAVDEGASL